MEFIHSRKNAEDDAVSEVTGLFGGFAFGRDASEGGAEAGDAGLAEDEECGVLAGLGQTVEHNPQRSLCRCGDGQQHLGERDGVAGYAGRGHDASRPER